MKKNKKWKEWKIWKNEKKKKKNEKKWKNEKWKKCTARDDTSSSSAAALREGTPQSYPQLPGGYGICIWELTERTGLAPSRIGKPRKSSSRKSCENSQEVAELKRFAWLKLERTEQLRVDDLSRQKFTNVSLQWISWRFKLRNCKIKCTLWMVLPWSRDSKQFWVLPRSQSSFICSEFFRKALPRF